jgi:hypothetical protein
VSAICYTDYRGKSCTGESEIGGLEGGKLGKEDNTKLPSR